MFVPTDIKQRVDASEPAIFKKTFPKIFSWEELERLLNFRPHITLHERFRVISCSERFIWQPEDWVSEINSIPATMLDKEIIQNYHCAITDASRVNKQINNICKELENLFDGSAADAHIFFNIANKPSQGFGIHWDQSYNLIVQVEGISKIEVWSSEVTGQPDGSLEKLPDPILVDTLNPGDAVFIPIKTYHQITSLSKRLSVSFPFIINSSVGPQDRHWIKL